MKATLALLGCMILCGHSIAASEAALTIIDEANKSHTVAATDVTKMPRVKAEVQYHGKQIEFEGALLSDVLKSAGVEFGDALRGKRAATVAILEAADDYRTALTLLEIDPDTTDKMVILADRRNGGPLEENEAPFRLVIPDEKRPIRWIRMIRSIRVVNLRDLPPDTSRAKEE